MKPQFAILVGLCATAARPALAEAPTEPALDVGVDGLITNNTSLMWKAVALRSR